MHPQELANRANVISGATKNNVIIFDESQRLLSDSSEETERPQEEQTTIQKQFPFYSSRSKHGVSAADGALRNKRPVHVVSDRERQFRSNHRETKARLDSLELLQRVDDQARDLYDKVKMYPKTHQDQAMQKVNRDYQQSKWFHKMDDVEGNQLAAD